MILGISADPVEKQAKFKTKYGLPYTLLADTGHEVAEAYGVWVEKSMYGRKYMGLERSSFLIDEKGKIKKVFEKVKAEAHAAEVLEGL